VKQALQGVMIEIEQAQGDLEGTPPWTTFYKWWNTLGLIQYSWVDV